MINQISGTWGQNNFTETTWGQNLKLHFISSMYSSNPLVDPQQWI